MTASLDEIDALLKTKYSDEVPMIGKKDPVAWATIRKTTSFNGRSKEFAVQYGCSTGVSHTFTDAQNNADAEAYDFWLVTRARDYVTMRIDGEAYEACSGDGAKKDYLTRATETAKGTAKWRLNRSFYRNGGGSIARLLAAGAGGGTQVITVQDPLDLLLLSKGHVIVSSNTDGLSGAVDANPGTISKINRRTGQITRTSGNWNTVTGFSDDDYIFIQGDFGADFTGFSAWVPPADPSATLFYGVDRTDDELRLSGNRIAATADDGTLENFFQRALTEVGVQGGNPKMTAYVHPTHVTQFAREVGNKVEYTKIPAQTSQGESAEIGFKAITIQTGACDLDIIGDRDAPRHTAHVIDRDTVSFEGLKEAPRFLTYGGLETGTWLRLAGADSMEARVGAKGQFVFHAPGNCANLDLSALTDPA